MNVTPTKKSTVQTSPSTRPENGQILLRKYVSTPILTQRFKRPKQRHFPTTLDVTTTQSRPTLTPHQVQMKTTFRAYMIPHSKLHFITYSLFVIVHLKPP